MIVGQKIKAAVERGDVAVKEVTVVLFSRDRIFRSNCVVLSVGLHVNENHGVKRMTGSGRRDKKEKRNVEGRKIR